MTGQKEYDLVGFGFLLLFLSFFIKAFMNIQIYFEIVSFLVSAQSTKILVYSFGYFIHRFFFLLGLLYFLNIALELPDKRTNVLIGLLLAIATVFSHNTFFVYHLVATVMLSLLFHHFVMNSRKKKTTSSNIVATSFLLLLISQVAFIFIPVTNELYVLGEASQLFGFLLLLINHMVVLNR
jgi:hypothetical protein